MIKRILVPLDPSDYTKTAIQVGAQIAKRTDAELTGLVILDIESIEDSIQISSRVKRTVINNGIDIELFQNNSRLEICIY